MPSIIQEKSIFKEGYRLIGAIDEVGRGPLAGPVVAACLFLRPEQINSLHGSRLLKDVRDSKMLSAKKREELYKIILDKFPVGIGICDHETVDRINILQATFLAMKKAISGSEDLPDFLLVDGHMSIPGMTVDQRAIIDGDEKIFSIAAASIIAKVTRDRIMDKIHQDYPHYAFDKNKGYGTELHLKALFEIGPCAVHRKSFEPVKSLLLKKEKIGKL